LTEKIIAENAWLNWGRGGHFIELYLGEGKGNIQISIPRSADILGSLRHRKMLAFKVLRNTWSVKTVKLGFKTPDQAQRFQEALADADDILYVQAKKSRSTEKTKTR